LNPERERYIYGRPLTWVDRIIYNLYALFLVGTLLGVPGLILAYFLLPTGTAHLVARWVLVAAVLTDLVSVYLDVTYLLRGGGLHGEAAFALAYYVVFVIFGLSAAWWWRATALAALAGLHIGCQWYLPQPIAWMLGWRPRSGESAWFRRGTGNPI
jgi:hypothetical protein